MPSNNIEGGYYLKARTIKNSAIAIAPPHVREIWDWILQEANYDDRKWGDTTIKRGQLVRSYKDIQESLKWQIGWRKMRYSKWQCENSMKWLKAAGMITTKRTIRGMLITVLNYAKYQDPKNYDNHNESHNGSRTSATHSPHYKERSKEIKKEEGGARASSRAAPGVSKYQRRRPMIIVPSSKESKILNT